MAALRNDPIRREPTDRWANDWQHHDKQRSLCGRVVLQHWNPGFSMSRALPKIN
jgi:hypothetical protein